MNKEDLDALAGLYESVYNEENDQEQYLTEIGVNFGGQSAVDRARAQQKQKVASDVKLAALRTQRFGSGGSPSARAGSSRGSSSTSYKSPFAANRDAAFAKAGQIKGSPVVGSATKVGGGSLSSGSGGGSPRPATPAPSATKVGGGSLSGGGKVAPTAAVKQTGDKAKDMQTWAKANPTLANKPQRTFNPLMQKTFGYQTGYSPSEVKGNMQKTKTLAGAGVLSNSYEWSSKTMKDIYSLYNSVYEAKKVDQDKDGDNDFADVRIARMIASGVPKNVAIAKVKNKPYNEEVEIEEATLSAKAARAGKDIGKPGKQFAKIAASAAKRYGSKERGEKVAGAVLKKMRAKAHEEFELSENEAYDIVSSYLLENNFAETIEDANVIIENMSASWVGEILDQYEASIQEDFQNWIQALLDEGYDLSEYSVEELSEIYYQQD